MALKDLFGNGSQVVVTKQLDDLYRQAESKEYVEQAIIDKDRFLPQIDFSTASNFARYGSAEKYYVDAIKNIYENYPYDGSRKEKQEWRNNSSQLDLYVFDNLYPKTVGYLCLLNTYTTLSDDGTFRSSSLPVYVKILGGPNASSTGKLEDANIYNLEKNRESNLAITSLGNTVEFWFKDNNPSNTYSYALFDLWNEKPETNNDYTRLIITKINSENKFAVTYRSGSSGVTNQTLDYTFDPTIWHHYAFTFANTNTNDLEVCLYVDGNLQLKNVFSGGGNIAYASNIGNIAYIGALRADIFTATNINESIGNATECNFDDFRFWKVARSSQDIYRNWHTQIGGGTNTDDANTDLGVYLKFNEGVIGNYPVVNDLDKICLDYSGRASNGLIFNYDFGVRLIGSAIDSYFYKTDFYGNQVFVETKDPIIFSSNPLVQNLLSTYSELGYQHDITNPSSIIKSIPSWIVDEAEDNNLTDLSILIQIIASYFDTLHIQIQELTNTKNIVYDSQYKPKTFAKNLLNSNGFDNIDIFNDTSFIEEFLSRNEEQEFKDKIHNIKNTIYQNIYNNLAYIYKSKGTEKSLRNLIRCFGVDDELIKINLYANNSEYELKTKYIDSTTTKKFIDFNDPNRYEGFIYQKNKTGDFNTRSYIPGSSQNEITYIPITLQAEVLFPKTPIIESNAYNVPDFTESSLFGVHQANSSPTNLSWGSDIFNFQVYSIRESVGSDTAKFKLTGSFNGYGIELLTPYYKEIYNNEKWNFAVRIKPDKYEYINLSSGSTNIENYILEFIGLNSVGNNLFNRFALTCSIPQLNMAPALKANKRVYVGAHYNNFNNSQILTRTDVKISSVRFWMDYVSDEELLAHSFESNIFGRNQPNWPPAFLSSFATGSIPLSKNDTLALHWNFYNVSSSNISGQLIVEDVSSGSLEAANYYGINWLNNIIRYQLPGFGEKFYPNDKQIVNKEYLFSAKKQNPEALNGNDLVQILETDDINRPIYSRPISYFISIEKSMAQVINDEIMNWFAAIESFNNLIGQPIDKYKQEYSGLNYLKEVFFSRVGNSLNFEKFFTFYRWIDSSLSLMVNQLIPASANATDKVRNMVESHMLERSKYENKLPSIEVKQQVKEAPINSHLSYKYLEQAAYNNNLTDNVVVSRYYNFKPRWLKQRAIRTEEPVNTVLEPQNDIDREIIRQVINERNINSLPKLYELDSSSSYDGRRDSTRIFTNVYNISSDRLYALADAIIPINIQNIPINSQFIFASEISASSSADQIISPYQKFNRTGNYRKPYETVVMSSRKNNNKSFVELEGNISGSSNIDTNLDIINRTLPNRSTHKTVIVERFSAPGGPEVSSRGYLDAAAEEYSVYNSLNYRNSRVRENLNSWLKESSSIDSENPSYHKVNKNVSYSPDPETGLRSADYDNWFIQHQIPQSDAQYSWITASLAITPSSSVFASPFSNLFTTASLQFLSGNISSSYIVDYLGLNLTITNSLNDSTNTLSAINFGNDLNKYLSNKNGPYSWPTWKQIRNFENALSVLSRKNNNILIQDAPKTKSRVINGSVESFYSSDEETFTAYKEPPIAYNKPVEQIITIKDSNQVSVLSSYDNNKEYFANEDLQNRTAKVEKNEYQTYDIIKQAGLDFNTELDVKAAKYNSIIYPAADKVGLKETRQRPNYTEVAGTGSNGYDRNFASIRTFWKNLENDRKRTNAFYSPDKTGSLNVLGFGQLSSSYSQIMSYSGSFRNDSTQIITSSKDYSKAYDSLATLENSSSIAIQNAFSSLNLRLKLFNSSSLMGDLAGHDEFELRQILALPSGSYFNVNVTKDAGTYLQERFKYDVNGNFVRPKPSYAYKIHYPSCVTSYVDGITNYINSYYLYNLGMPFKTAELAGKNPWYNSYEEYFEDLRPLSKNRTILPEYNFSENAEYYLSGSELKILPPENYISFIGTDAEVNKIDNAYNITDKIKNFIYNDFSGSRSLKITVDGVKKLLPYNGFYPRERTAQLVDLFQKSFWNVSMKDMVEGYPTYKTVDYASGSPLVQQMQTLLQPYFAPGILFNTIKAGIAMDWMARDRSYTYDFYGPTSIRNSVMYSTSSFDLTNDSQKIFVLNNVKTFRIPFESLLDLQGYSEDASLNYLDPTRASAESFIDTGITSSGIYSYPTSSLKYTPIFGFNNKNSNNNVTRKFINQLYSRAINNFLGETVKFFLEEEKLTEFTSNKIASDIRFISGSTYEMYVEISKDENLKMLLDTQINGYYFSGSTSYNTKIPAASTFGPPSHYIVHSTASEAILGHLAYNDVAFAPYAPPYYYGPQIIKFTFIPEQETYDSYKQIINNLKVSYEPANSQINDFFSASALEAGVSFISDISKTGTTMAYANRMTLSSSIKYDILVPKVTVTHDANANPINTTVSPSETDSVWRIQTKFETPILNFNNTPNKNLQIVFSGSDSDSPIATKIYTSKYANYGFSGMWSGYATSDDTSGVKLSLKSSATNTNNIKNLAEACGFNIETKRIGKLAEKKVISEAIVMIPFTKTKTHNRIAAGGVLRQEQLEREKNQEYARTIDQILGENGKTIDGEINAPYYFGIDKQIIDQLLYISTTRRLNFDSLEYDNLKRILSGLSDSIPELSSFDGPVTQTVGGKPVKNTILNTMKNMAKYVLPPHLDWLYNRNIQPFVMYFFEFEHTLNKQELADIWQGVMPQSAMKASMENANISLEHDLDWTQMFHGKKLPDDIQWKIFKVKKRAEYDYQSLVNGRESPFVYSPADPKKTAFSYNWPYDYFSLVELVNIDMELSVKDVAKNVKLPNLIIQAPRKTVYDGVELAVPPPAPPPYEPISVFPPTPSITETENEIAGFIAALNIGSWKNEILEKNNYSISKKNIIQKIYDSIIKTIDYSQNTYFIKSDIAYVAQQQQQQQLSQGQFNARQGEIAIFSTPNKIENITPPIFEPLDEIKINYLFSVTQGSFSEIWSILTDIFNPDNPSWITIPSSQVLNSQTFNPNSGIYRAAALPKGLQYKIVTRDGMIKNYYENGIIETINMSDDTITVSTPNNALVVVAKNIPDVYNVIREVYYPDGKKVTYYPDGRQILSRWREF